METFGFFCDRLRITDTLSGIILEVGIKSCETRR